MSLLSNLELVGRKPESITIQTFYDPHEDGGARNSPKIVAYYPGVIKDNQENFHAVCWAVNEQRIVSKRSNKNTKTFSCIGLDSDVAKEEQKKSKEEINVAKKELYIRLMKLGEFAPTGIIQSKNGLQPYWLFDPIEIPDGESDRFNQEYKSIVAGFIKAGFNSEADSIQRVLRFPGSLHRKTKHYPFEITHLDGTNNPISYEKLREKFWVEKEIKPVVYHEKNLDDSSLYNIDVRYSLSKLSGTDLVHGEVYDFTQDNGNYCNIIINGRKTGQWIDTKKNSIGGPPGSIGSPNIVEWVKWYGKEGTDDEIRRELDMIIKGDWSYEKINIKPTDIHFVVASRKLEYNKDEIQEDVDTGIKSFDESLSGGFSYNNVYVVGGAQKSGKSSLMVSIAQHQLKMGRRVCFINTELDNNELLRMFTANSIGVEKDMLKIDPSPIMEWQKNYSDLFYHAGIGVLTDKKNEISFELMYQEAEKAAQCGWRIFVWDNITSIKNIQVKGVQDWQVLSSAAQRIVNFTKKYNAISFCVLHTKGSGSEAENPKNRIKKISEGDYRHVFEKSIVFENRPTTSDLYGGNGMLSQLSGTVLVWRPYMNFGNNNMSKTTLIIMEKFRGKQVEAQIEMIYEGAKCRFVDKGVFVPDFIRNFKEQEENERLAGSVSKLPYKEN